MHPDGVHIRFPHLLFLFGILCGLHFFALETGLYHGKPWIDMPLHIIGGLFLALSGWWLVTHVAPRQETHLGKLLSSFAVASVALWGAFLWEVFEFATWQLAPHSAYILQWYSPTVSDLLSDMIMSALGGIVMAIIFYIASARPNTDN